MAADKVILKALATLGTRELLRKAGLSTVDLLVKIGCFVRKKNIASA
jgi:hypothetical protein